MKNLIIAIGSNQGDSLALLSQAIEKLEALYGPCIASRVYTSKAVDLLDQPNFFNQVLCFELPATSPQKILEEVLQIEKSMGRVRDIKYGPRFIDIDLIFYSTQAIATASLMLPHPKLLQRSFVVRPMLELPIADWLRANFDIPEHFDTEAYPYH